MLLCVTILWTGACGGIPLDSDSPLHRADAIVVLGNRPPTDGQGRVMPETRRRVETGVRLWQAGLAPILVMAGGPAPHDRVEADVMAGLAVYLGVPAKVIRTERASTDTISNARNTVRLLCETTENDAGCRPRVIVVSSRYHLRRARDLFRCAGAEVQVAATPEPNDRDYRLRFLWSERMIRFAYAFIDPCGRARAADAPKVP